MLAASPPDAQVLSQLIERRTDPLIGGIMLVSPLQIRTDVLFVSHNEWWREQPSVRWYYRLELADGRTFTFFQDRVANRWFQQEYGR